MLDMDTLNWEEPLAHRMKVERNLNFATLPNDEDDFGFSRKKTARDPMSHRIIEKRRRDRMNNCLADLSRLVPTNYLKKGRGRIEKTEIIEMAIKHLKHLQAHPCKDPGSCEVAKATEQDHRRQFRQGYQECMSETMKFMMEVEGSWIVDGVGIRLVNHLQKHYDKLNGGLCYTQALNLMASEDSSSKSSSTNQQMEVDNNNSNASFHNNNNNNNNSSSHSESLQQQNPAYYDDASGRTTESDSPTASVRLPTSQLREMLQNPGVPTTTPAKDRSVAVPPSPRQQQGNESSQHESLSTTSHGESQQNQLLPLESCAKGEDISCYKFKNTIKHRFNADLSLHHSHTDGHASDRMTSDEDNTTHRPAPTTTTHHPSNPAMLCNSPNPLHQPQPQHQHHAFSPYHHAVTELTVKIPDPVRSVPSDSSSYHNWDSNSCGSNPSSPPPSSATARSPSSSGYSTGGDLKTGSAGGGGKGPLSPYTPDRLPSPQPLGVPIFALHPKGAFYIPLTVEASLLVPYMVGIDDSAPPVLHPISICVNLGAHSVKVEKPLHHPRPVVQASFLMDRLVYSSERHHHQHQQQQQAVYYPCPGSPVKNGHCA